MKAIWGAERVDFLLECSSLSIDAGNNVFPFGIRVWEWIVSEDNVDEVAVDATLEQVDLVIVIGVANVSSLRAQLVKLLEELVCCL